MSDVSAINSNATSSGGAKPDISGGLVQGQGDNIQAYLPEPSTSNGGLGFDLMNGVATTVETVGSMAGLSAGPYGQLINQQIKMQMEMATTSMVSNIEKSKHETKMAAIRNIRVG